MGRERCIKSAENESEPFRMFGLNSLFISSPEEQFKTLVLKTSDHNTIIGQL